MELCSLEDAFPEINKQTIQGSGASLGTSLSAASQGTVAPLGCTKASKEERRAKRKAKKAASASAPTTLPDPDRQAVVQLPDVPPLKRLGEVSALTTLADAFPDLSGVTRMGPKWRTSPLTDELVGEADPEAEGFGMPRLPGSSCTFSDPGLPGYFGKGLDDEEGFADYSGAPGDDPGYRLIPATLDGSFEAKGAAKAAGGLLPTPSVKDVWKPLTPAGARTAFYSSLPAPGGRIVERVEPELPTMAVEPTEDTRRQGTAGAPTTAQSTMDATREALLKRIQDLTKRLDDLETRSARNSQQEILVFTAAGLGLLVCFDLVVRAARG